MAKESPVSYPVLLLYAFFPRFTDALAGDRVAIEPGVPCGKCFLCMDGRYNLCEDVQFVGVYPYHGTIQRYKCHPAKWCHKLPSNVSYKEGALLEPLSVVLHGIKLAGVSLGRGVVICGAGPIGLIALKAARASGAHPLVITDLDTGRLSFAKKFVPECQTYRVERDLDPESNAKRIRELFNVATVGEYGAPETVLECTGVESSVATACYTARRGGTVMVIGVGREIMNNLPFMHLSLAEVSQSSCHFGLDLLSPPRELTNRCRLTCASLIATVTRGQRAYNVSPEASSISSHWSHTPFHLSGRWRHCMFALIWQMGVSKCKL